VDYLIQDDDIIEQIQLERINTSGLMGRNIHTKQILHDLCGLWSCPLKERGKSRTFHPASVTQHLFGQPFGHRTAAGISIADKKNLSWGYILIC
jgi:hypothetical protein